jgi:hypothetical protein
MSGRVWCGGKAGSVKCEASVMKPRALEAARGSARALSPRVRGSRAKGGKKRTRPPTIALRHDGAKQAQMGRWIAKRKRKAARTRPLQITSCQ